MMKIHERYRDDPLFRRMVELLVGMIEAGQITPTEAREAAMLAQIMYEDRHPRPVYFTKEQVMRGEI